MPRIEGAVQVLALGRPSGTTGTRPEVLGKGLRLLPGGEVTTPVELVEVDQVRVGPLGPAAWRLIRVALSRASLQVASRRAPLGALLWPGRLR